MRCEAGRLELMDRVEYRVTAHPNMPFKEQKAFIRASDAEQDRQIAEGDGGRATLDDLAKSKGYVRLWRQFGPNLRHFAI